MTVNEVVSLFRMSIKQYSDDTIYTDRYLWSLFNIQKAKLISQKYKSNDPQNYNTICIELTKGLSHECGCITMGCEVFKSVQLPRWLTTRNSTLKVFTLDYKPMYQVSEENYRDMLEDKTYEEAGLYSIVNRKIVSWNKPYGVVMVSARWEDILDLDSVQYCKDSNKDDEDSSNCQDVYSMDIGLDAEFVDYAIRMALELLYPTLNIRDDETSDTNDTIKL